MAYTVLSMLKTIPFTTPSDSALPMPSTSSFPNSFLRPTITQILVVPMSSPTTIFSCSMIAILFSGCCILYLGVKIFHSVQTTPLQFVLRIPNSPYYIYSSPCAEEFLYKKSSASSALLLHYLVFQNQSLHLLL